MDDQKKDPSGDEFSGNIWGWRFSLISGAVMALLLGLAAYRHYALGVPFGHFPEPVPVQPGLPVDSLPASDTLALPQ